MEVIVSGPVWSVWSQITVYQISLLYQLNPVLLNKNKLLTLSKSNKQLGMLVGYRKLLLHNF